MYRLRLLFALFVFFVVLVWLRLFYWQILLGEKIKIIASAQHKGKYSLLAQRGEIFTADGYPLVLNGKFYRVVADPRLIEDERRIAEQLSSVIISDVQKKRARALQVIHESTGATEPGVFYYSDDELSALQFAEQQRILSLLDKKELRWVQLFTRVSEEIKSHIASLQLRGISFEDSFGRMYPEASLSGTLSGLLISDVNGLPKGAYGIEGKYDGELAGKSGRLVQQQDVFGRPILAGDRRFIDARQGSDLHLTIDRTVQYIAQKALYEGIQKYGAQGGTIIIMHPRTGAVLAMVSYPHIDPLLWEYFPTSWYKNPAISETYEPGSTFKVVVMAAGIDAGVIDYNTICTLCDKPRQIGHFVIRTWNNQYRINPTMVDVLLHSDNTGMVFIGDRLGKEKLYSYLFNFGFGSLTGIDLQDEESSPLRPLDQLTEIDFATLTFGQGVAVTPLQMIFAVSAIANDGWLMKPYVVQAIKRDGKIIEIQPQKLRQVISAQTAYTMTDIMVKVVEHGEAKLARIPGYKVAGKTGTAQVALDGSYDESKTIASFVGFAPADDPQFIMLVKLNYPTSSPWGSSTAAPLFFSIARQLFDYYKIPPDNQR